MANNNWQNRYLTKRGVEMLEFLKTHVWYKIQDLYNYNKNTIVYILCGLLLLSWIF